MNNTNRNFRIKTTVEFYQTICEHITKIYILITILGIVKLISAVNFKNLAVSIFKREKILIVMNFVNDHSKPKQSNSSQN